MRAVQALICLPVFLALGCGGGSSPSAPAALAIQPAAVTVLTGSSVAFSASLGGAPDPAVTWSVLE
ncbi:MAG: hypothetical protein HGA66_18920, partial [Holophaga sp.]|nr:hypothetical protein [Holophaga sp.]